MKKTRWVTLSMLAMLVLPLFGSPQAQAQGDSRLFPETGKTVRSKFLAYWNTHGGLAQQGYPISEEMQEVSDTNGQTYTVQYFERAVFELHPEFAGTSNEVLLQLLGVFLYKQKYPNGAPGQNPSADPSARSFPETGHRVGGKFLAYWNTHGGLAQQGYPLSEEFVEVSDLNGKPYTVQYFERAVFELHPEFAGTPNEVLLSQLGTFRYRQKYQGGTAGGQPTVAPPPANTPVVPPTARPAQPTATPPSPCSGIPASPDVLILPTNCEPAGTQFAFAARGFTPGESVGVYITRPDQSVNGAPFQVGTDSDGYTEGVTFTTTSSSQKGLWAITFEGVDSHHKSIGYFKLR